MFKTISYIQQVFYLAGNLYWELSYFLSLSLRLSHKGVKYTIIWNILSLHVGDSEITMVEQIELKLHNSFITYYCLTLVYSNNN